LLYLIIFDRELIRIYVSTLGIERKLEGLDKDVLAAKLEALLKSLGRTEEWRYNRLKKEGKL
jgi:hypothetical protein